MGRREPALDLLGEDDEVTARLYPAVLLALAVLLVGCGSARTDTSPESTRTGSPVPAAPPRGACYPLDVAAALRASSTVARVPCAGPHTSVTVAVGTLDTVVDGRPLAIDSARAQRQIANRCRAKVDRHVGGSVETQRLSLVQAVWFSPTPTETDRGARWYRCDLVISSGTRAFLELPRRTRGLLRKPGALDRYGVCGTAAPGTSGFSRVVCSDDHRWRARATISLPAGTRYLSKAAGSLANDRCRDVAARRAADVLHLRWSFEWPTRAQWKARQRYGLCWTPD